MAKSPRTGKTKVSRTLDLAGLSRSGRPPSVQATTDHPQPTPDPPAPDYGTNPTDAQSGKQDAGTAHMRCQSKDIAGRFRVAGGGPSAR